MMFQTEFRDLTRILDLDVLLVEILSEARRMVRADGGSVYLKEKDRNYLALRYTQIDSLAKELPPGQKLFHPIFSLSLDEKRTKNMLCVYAALQGLPINVPDMDALPPDSPYSLIPDEVPGYRTRSALAVPFITASGRFLGLIQLSNAQDSTGKIIPFSPEAEAILVRFARYGADLLEGAFVRRSLIFRLIKMAELRDPNETWAHVNRVAAFAVEIYDRWALRRGLEEKERRDLFRVAAMLHDAGKVAISELILKKPARFTREEFGIMQRHTLYGALLFQEVYTPLDTLAGEIALTHHENWDGSGYPGYVEPLTEQIAESGVMGKPRKGEEIPLEGRIVALADVFDALCSKRVYKETLSLEEVLEEIRNLAGSKFDPELVDIFFEILPSIRQIQSLYPEQ
jgi:HD-GYP domain-containing protein (c-di-GMP phosphodiesterase class II)